MLTEKYFETKDFSQTKLFDEFVEEINSNPPLTIDLNYFSVRDLLGQFKRKTLILFKLILLQKKVLFLFQPIENLVKTILTLVSLVPNLIENGLDESTLIDANLNYENEIHLNTNEDVVFQLNEIQLKTIKDEDTNSIQSNESKVDEFKFNLLQRASSITSKLTDTFTRLTNNSNVDIQQTQIDQHYLSYLEQFHFPLQLFNKVRSFFFEISN